MPVYLPGLTFGTGYGGAAYAFSPYGGAYFPRSPVPVTEGFGGSPYSYSSYGSLGGTPSSISSAVSITGFVIRVFFSEEMLEDANIITSANYILTESYGVPVTVTSVTVSSRGADGVTSIEITHTGTTLGGSYEIVASNLLSFGGIPLSSPRNRIFLYTVGDNTTYTVDAGTEIGTLRLNFLDSLSRSQELLTESEFSPGVDTTSSYDITGTYPIIPLSDSAVQNTSDLSEVLLEVSLLTETTYNMLAGPALAFNYNGTVLPEDATNFVGSKIGTGTGTVSATGLFLSKTSGSSFGYSFGDSSGKVLPNSSYRVDFEIDPTTSTISPTPLNETFATFSVSDGVIEIKLLLRDISGTKILEVVSGGFSAQIPCDWYNTSQVISVIRNQKGNFFSVLCNNYPELTFSTTSATGTPTHGSGCAFVIASDFEVSLFKIVDINFTSSQTLFTKQWNFLHSLITPFTGAGVVARNVIKTKRGPLVRGWGDNTIAKKEDVTLRINGTSVAIANINPYIGEIYPAIPIPVGPPSSFTVDIDYIWFQNPSLPMLGLNTQGLNLNIWDRHDGHTAGAVSPLPANSLGVVKTNRFPMGITLGPGERKSPKKIGHRYIGFQNDYSALLNQDTLLQLNKNPHAISDGAVTAEGMQQKGLFNGRVLPGSAGTPWTLSGVDSGALVGDGTYRLIDNSTGSYSVGLEGTYSRDLDLSLECIITEIARFKVESYTADGVFTGVGFGFYDGHNLCLIGAVLISGVQHFGLLLDGSNPHIAASWKIGFEYTAVAVSTTVIKVPYAGFPRGVEEGDRFRVSEGNQAGVYTIAECGLNLDLVKGLVEITVTTELPAPISIVGNETFNLFFETIWDTNLVSFRIVADYPNGNVNVDLGSEISGVFLTNQAITPYPAQTALLIPAGEKGASFWGSISRKAINSAVWDIIQYLLNPIKILETVDGRTIRADMNVLPQDETLEPWYVVSGFGKSSVGSSILDLKSSSSSTDKDTSFYYQKVEPFISNKVETDLETTFRVISGNSIGDAEIQIRDGTREVSFKTLLYLEDASKRYLLTDIPTCSLSGLLSPEKEGWTESASTNVTTSVTGQILTIQKTKTQAASWFLEKPYTGMSPEGCILSFDLKLSSTTSGSNGVGLVFEVSLPTYPREFQVRFDTGVLEILDNTSWVPFAFNWDDGAFHEYKITADPIGNTVSVIVDGSLLGTLLYSNLTPVTSGFFGATVLGSGDGLFTAALNSFSLIPLKADANVKKTFGIQIRGGDENDINGYVIPRTDGTSAQNSSLSATPVLMDPTSYVEVRLFLDPLWGISFYRPDINMPNGNPYIAGTTDPLNAWVNVEYRNLPVLVQERGSVSFGSINPYSVSEQDWDYLQYRVRKSQNGYGVAPQGMVLNRATKLTSGEFLFDKTLEDKTFNSRSSTLIYIPDSALYAGNVYKVIVDGVVLSSTNYSFDKFTQYVVLSNPLPKNIYSVRVIFSIGHSITKEYLCGEPIDNSVTLLNEGTPPIPRDRIGSPPKPYLGVEFCEKTDGDSVNISSMCDGPGPGKGLVDIGIEGRFTTNSFEVPHGPGGVWGKSSPTLKGSATHHSLPIFHASGGSYTGPTLSPGSMMLYPNQQVSTGNKGMGLNQDFTLRLETVTPYADNVGIQTSLGDNVPPSTAETISNNPNGVAGTFGNGAAAYLQEDYGVDISRLGPWGGLSSLTKSLLAGGSQLNGDQFTLQGGSQIAVPVRTSGVLEAAS